MTAVPKSRRACLLDVRPLGGGAARYTFEVRGQVAFDFVPGQYVCLRKELEGVPCDRHYSIASAPDNSNRFELCINYSRDRSPFGGLLRRIEAGEEFELRGPQGAFRLREPVRETLFIATGTGVSPLRSMIQHLAENGNRDDTARVTLLFGARRNEGLYFGDEFQATAERHGWFRYLPTLSQPSPEWSGLRGYVQNHLDDAIEEHGRPLDVYVCGQPEMVRDVGSLLRRAGIDAAWIHSEKYE